MSNYGRDLPSGWSFPAGVHAGKIKKLVRREEARVSALGSEERLLDLARQHFPPSTATERSGRDWDRKAYLEQRGPYVGRYLGQDGSRAFKLHASERKRPQRQADIKARLDKMDVQFAAYNKVRCPLVSAKQ